MKFSGCQGKIKGLFRYAHALHKLKNKRKYEPQTQSQENKLRYDSNTIESWRFSLSSVVDMVSFELEACNG